MADSVEYRPVSLWVMLVSLLLLGVGGIYGGIALMADPSGEVLNIPFQLDGKLPLHSFFLPGLFLLVSMGFAPIYTAYGISMRARWGWLAALGLDFVLICLMIVELVLFGYKAPIQAITGFLGIVIFVTALFPDARQYLSGPGGENG